MSDLILPGQQGVQPPKSIASVSKIVRDISGQIGLQPMQKTSEYGRKFRPWAVRMVISADETQQHLTDSFYFIRMGNPEDAGAMAEKMFQQWERGKFVKDGNPWPDSILASAECIDEGDWKNQLKDARRAKVFRFFGDSALHPQIFMFYGAGWPKVWKDHAKRMALRS
jgi:hypothetical protein